MPDPAPGGRPPTQRIPAPVPPAARPPTQSIPAARPPTQRIPVPATPSAKPPTQKVPVVEAAPAARPPTQRIPAPAARPSSPRVPAVEAAPAARPPTQRIPVPAAPPAKPPTQKVPVVEAAPAARPPTQRIPVPAAPPAKPPTQRVPVVPEAKPPTRKVPVVEPPAREAPVASAPEAASGPAKEGMETAEASTFPAAGSGAKAGTAAAPGDAPATGATSRRPVSLHKKLTRKQKYIRLTMIFSTPMLCLVLAFLVLQRWKEWQEAGQTKKTVFDAEQQWQKHIDRARDGQRKVEECFFLIQSKEGEVPADAKAKFDADLAEGRKILEEALVEMEKLRKDAGEGVSEWDRDIYPLQKNVMLAKRLADEKDRKPIIAYPKRYKEVMDAIAKVQREYADNKEKMTPEKQKEIVAAAEKACKEAQELAEQWGELLDKYAVANKTSERMDPEEEAVSKLSLAVGTTRKLLKDLK